MRILVTGGAGFIGSHLCERLVSNGNDIVIIDNFNDFYDPLLKRRNMDHVFSTAEANERAVILSEGDICDFDYVKEIIAQESPDIIIHLAAAAGVRPSLANPFHYEEVNVRGTLNLLEAAKQFSVKYFIYASSSSVYGDSSRVPFSENDPVDNPISPYAATKKAGELICHTYHHLYAINIACLRFFTVYGPRQRPDLAINKFTRLIDAGMPIPFYGDGKTSRDYTFIDDIIDGVERAINWVVDSEKRYSIFNLGESQTVELRRLVEVIESSLGKKAILDMQPIQPGDVPRTCADITKSTSVLGYQPKTTIEKGVREFVDWYLKECK